MAGRSVRGDILLHNVCHWFSPRCFFCVRAGWATRACINVMRYKSTMEHGWFLCDCLGWELFLLFLPFEDIVLAECTAGMFQATSRLARGLVTASFGALTVVVPDDWKLVSWHKLGTGAMGDVTNANTALSRPRERKLGGPILAHCWRAGHHGDCGVGRFNASLPHSTPLNARQDSTTTTCAISRVIRVSWRWRVTTMPLAAAKPHAAWLTLRHSDPDFVASVPLFLLHRHRRFRATLPEHSFWLQLQKTFGRCAWCSAKKNGLEV